jgi:hypothetical protein
MVQTSYAVLINDSRKNHLRAAGTVHPAAVLQRAVRRVPPCCVDGISLLAAYQIFIGTARNGSCF